MTSTLYRSLLILFMQFSLSLPSFAIDKKDFINRAGLMMMAPCTVEPYLRCIQVKQAVCKQAVKHAGKQCSDRVPAKVSKQESQAIMQTLGSCMSTRIVAELRLSKEKIMRCRAHLGENTSK